MEWCFHGLDVLPAIKLSIMKHCEWGAQSATNSNRWPCLVLSSSTTRLLMEGLLSLHWLSSAITHMYNYIIIILLLVVPLSWTWCLFFCLSVCLYFCREDYWAESYEQIYVKFLVLCLQQETVRCCRWSGFGSSSSFGPSVIPRFPHCCSCSVLDCTNLAAAGWTRSPNTRTFGVIGVGFYGLDHAPDALLVALWATESHLHWEARMCSEDCSPSGDCRVQGRAPGEGLVEDPRCWRHFFVKICYFVPVLISSVWNGRKINLEAEKWWRLATIFAHWAQKNRKHWGKSPTASWGKNRHWVSYNGSDHRRRLCVQWP